ncbi:MAG TPA: crotonase/enoyl-CoA hydratase family protein [Actinokineospora sp.]|jgi:enoyl-CoA hydratase|nr:crotonase/enoyl-CoA hydratase family protein [Actinokineospora sp.]
MTVITEVAGNVLVITLNRPESRNAINLAMADAVDTALLDLDADPALAVGILTGAGGTFCSGMDLKAFPHEGIPVAGDRGLAGLTRARPRKPLIAAVEGHAVAGGCELALACDLIVASVGSRFGLPEVCRGLVAGEGGAVRLPRRIPYHVAMEMLLTGDSVTGVDAARWGMVNRLVPDGGALGAALTLAERISVNAPLAIAAVKDIVRRTEGVSDADAMAMQDPLHFRVARSFDAVEGALAFAEKRPARWRHR